MTELAATSDPKQLVEGEPNEIRASTRNLTWFGGRFLEIGDGFKRLDAGGWKGEAGEAFRQRFDREPLRWIKAGESFQDAAKALNDYAGVLEWGQTQAAEAIHEYETGQRATERAKAEHEQTPGSSPVPFHDPGESRRQHAQDMLHRARQQVDNAGYRAKSAVDAAKQDAPEKPTLLDDIGSALAGLGETLVDIPGNLVHYGMDGFGNFVDLVGTATAGVVDGAGKLAGGALDLVGLDEQGETVEQSTEAASDDLSATMDQAADNVREAADDVASTLGAEDPPAYGVPSPAEPPQPVIVQSEKYPESAQHIEEAQSGNIFQGDRQRAGEPKSSDVTIDKENADINRREALRGIPSRGGDYLDRDEYPPAMFEEGGDGSSVKYIDASDNRGAGSSMNAQIRSQDLGRGDQARIIVE